MEGSLLPREDLKRVALSDEERRGYADQSTPPRQRDGLVIERVGPSAGERLRAARGVWLGVGLGALLWAGLATLTVWLRRSG